MIKRAPRWQLTTKDNAIVTKAYKFLQTANKKDTERLSRLVSKLLRAAKKQPPRRTRKAS